MFSSALLPGPGTYQPKFEAAELFERPPSAKLKPKRNAAVPRKVILPETLDILHSPAQKQPAGKLISRLHVDTPFWTCRFCRNLLQLFFICVL